MADRTTDYLQSRLGKSIKLNRKGPESKTGMLLDLNSEFFTVLTEEDGVVYYTMHHVKSLSHNAKTKEKVPFELTDDFTYLTASTFKELLASFDQYWVHVNHGPEKVEGVLSAVEDEWATIVTQEEVVRVNIYHIKTLSYGNKLQKNEDHSNEKENNEGNNEKKNKKDDSGK